MAKTSKIVKNNKRLDTVNFYTEKRKDLLAIIKDPDSTYDEKKSCSKKRLQKCQEMHLPLDIETDVK